MRRRWRYEIVAVVSALVAVAGCAADDPTIVGRPQFSYCGELEGCIQHPVRIMNGEEWETAYHALDLMSSTGACADLYWQAWDWVNDGGWVYDFDKGDWGHWHADSDEIHLWEGTFDFPFEVGVTLFHEAAHRLGMNEEQAEAAALNCVL